MIIAMILSIMGHAASLHATDLYTDPYDRYPDTSTLRDMTFKDLRDLTSSLPQPDLKTVVQSLPQTFKDHYVLMHHSRSAQKASPTKPRVIMFGESAKLILGYSGHPNAKGCEILETMEFSDLQNRFTLREMSFCQGTVKISEPNPRKCLGCHQQYNRYLNNEKDPRPNWEPYNLWPQSYQPHADSLILSRNSYSSNQQVAEDPLLSDYEKKMILFSRNIKVHYQEFLAATTNDELYNQLKPINPEENDQVVNLTNKLTQLNFRRIARISQQPKFEPIRHLLLGAALNRVCPSGELDIPEDAWDKLKSLSWNLLPFRPLSFSLARRSYVQASQDSVYFPPSSFMDSNTFWSVFPAAMGISTEDWSMGFTFKGKFAVVANRFMDPQNLRTLTQRAFSIVYGEEELSEMGSCEDMNAQLKFILSRIQTKES